MHFVGTAFRRLSVFLVLIGCWLGVGPLLAETPQQHLSAIIRDTQKQGNRAGRMTLVWWMPTEFWRTAAVANGTLTAAQIDEMTNAVRDIIVFAIIDGKVGGLGQATFVQSEELRKNLALLDSDGRPISLLPEDKQPIATKNLLAMMKPVLTNMLGEFGKNVTFFVFEGKNAKGAQRVDPLKPGGLTVKLNSEEYRWRLPLGSLLPPKTCPKCNETFPGNYAFCPFDATPLKEQAAENK